MAALPADDGVAVLGVIMADGTFDDLRQQLVTQLKKDVRRLCCARTLVLSIGVGYCSRHLNGHAVYLSQ